MAKWKSQLKVGKIEYQVPGQMLMQHAATATGTLKQSERMKVELMAVDSPDDFTIVPEGGELVRFVPI